MLTVPAQSTSSSYSSLRARVPAECGKLQEHEAGVLPAVAGTQDLVVHWVQWVHWVHCPCHCTEKRQRGGVVHWYDGLRRHSYNATSLLPIFTLRREHTAELF